MRLFDPDGLIAGSPDPAPGSAAGPGSPGSGAAGPSVAPGPTRRLRMVVAYDGSRFRGFAAQTGAKPPRTVAGELARAITKVAGHEVRIVCAGRTDAGVHARGQVIHVDVTEALDPASLARSLNSMLGPEVVVRSAELAPAGFDARHSATERSYRYLVYESPVPDPLLAAMSWHVEGPLDLRAMAQAADAFVGEHDFRALCRRPPGAGRDEPLVRRVTDARWSIVGVPPELSDARYEDAVPARLLRFDVCAQAFCHQMVRSMVGLLVLVGRGRRPAADVPWLLASGRRQSGVPLAPASGLCLVSVDYS